MSMSNVPCQCSVEPDWDVAIVDGDAFWVSGHTFGDAVSTHDRIRTQKSSGSISLIDTDNFTAEYTPASAHRSARLGVTDLTRDFSCTFVAPSRTYRGLSGKKSLSLDISPGGELGVVGGSDGQLTVFSTDDGSIQRILKGHVTDVDTCRFFPSGKVVLSADLALRIWDISTGDCAAALTGHIQGVTDTAIVDRGRNIISVSRDGTARLWDCGTQKQITLLTSIDGHINQCAIGTVTGGATDSAVQHDERESATENKTLLLACEDGNVRGIDVYNRVETVRLDLGCAATACAYNSGNEIVTGNSDGLILHWDIRQTSAPLNKWQAATTSVRSIATGQGEPWVSLANGRVQHGSAGEVLTGPDCDPCFRVCHSNGRVFTACRDAAVRRYDI